MTTFYNRPIEEQKIINNAYAFEVNAIEELNTARNPFRKIILAWVDGREIWEAIEVALELAYH